MIMVSVRCDGSSLVCSCSGHVLSVLQGLTCRWRMLLSRSSR
jgi:hypothetical protein